MDNFSIAVEIMWKGMLGIFTACLLIMAAVWIMGKVTGKKNEEN